MSQENVDRTRESIDAVNRGDFDGALARWDPDVRFEHRLAALEGSFTGVDGVRRWFADIAEHFDAWQIDCTDIRDLDDRVLALGTVRMIGKESGAETEMPFTVVARIQDGLVTEFIDYADREKALEAAGLRE